MEASLAYLEPLLVRAAFTNPRPLRRYKYL